MISLIFPVSFADALASLGIEYLTFDSRSDIVEVIESCDHELMHVLKANADYYYRIA